MKKIFIVTAAMVSMSVMVAPGFAETKKGAKIDGKAKFDQHCASCHPKGGNIVNAQKGLSKKALAANGIKTEKDIVAKMRTPGPGMTKFDAKTVPDAEAKAIAKYVLATFK